MRFEELNLSAPLLEAIAQLDFTEMTEIQEKAIPLLLEGKDVIGKSNTAREKLLHSASRSWNRWDRCPRRSAAMCAL